MTSTGVYLNDAAFAVSGRDRPNVVIPSIVHFDPAHPEKLGSPASDVARLTPRLVSADHWTALMRAGREVSSGVRLIIRAELRARLAGRSTDGPLQCAVPAALGSEALSVVLALMQQEGLEVGAFHDAASLLVANSGLSGTTIVLEMGLGHVSATRVESDRDVHRGASTTRYGAGVLALNQCWLQRLAEAMVLHTRFDPLHDGLSEQRLHDGLETAYSTAARMGVAEIAVPTETGVSRVSFSRDQFAEAASSIYAEVLGILHEHRSAGSRTNILVEDRVLKFPGFLERLASLRGCRIFSCATDLVSRIAADESISAESDGSVSFQRRYSLRQASENLAEVDLSEFRSAADRPPTHALLDGKAVALPSGILEIGRGSDVDGLRLGEGLAGISRLHCALQGDESGVTLVPYSPQGTWLNEERVRGRVRVCSGDRLRIGTPGVVIELIAVGGADHGAPSER
jgi:hypothetical protein